MDHHGPVDHAPPERPPGVAPAAVADLPAAPAVRPQLSDRGAISLALAICLGAWWHPHLPIVVGLGVAAGAWMVRHPSLLVVAGLALAASLGARSMAGMVPVEPGAYRGMVTLVADPEPTPFGTKVDVRVGHRRIELWASGGAAGAVSRSLAGERLVVQGRCSPPRPGSPWLVPRHVVGRLSVAQAERAGSGSPPWRAANRFRRLLERGTDGMAPTTRALYAGFVLGDAREQPPEIADDFRGSGLTHLLVVSGQNVAFVLVLLRPVVERVGWRTRWAITMGVIGAFGTVTRFEPSVLRASAMAALAVTAGALGRPSSSVRNLALGISGLVLIDPLLVRSIGFQLSCGASLAIALLARPIAQRIPGPKLVAESFGVTLAAQVGVAPILIPRFGGMPVVSLLANPVAVPVAGLVTTWGLPAGVIAGLVGGRFARVLHLPTSLMIGWVAGVARTASSIPLGEVGAPAAVVLLGLGLAVAIVDGSWARRSCLMGAAVLLVLPAVVLRSPPEVERLPGGGAVYRAGGATVVAFDGGVDIAEAMESLRRAGVRRIDALVTDGGEPAALAGSLRHRWVVRRAIDAREASAGRIEVGRIVVTTDPPAAPRVQIAQP